jgi:hypothetical protein
MVARCRVVGDDTVVRRSPWVERSRIMERWCADRLTALLTGTLTAVLTDELAGRSGRVFTLQQLTATLTATLTGLLTATLTDPGHSPVNARGPVRPRIGKGYACRNIVLVTWRSELHHVPPPLDTLDFRALVRMPTSLTCGFVSASRGYPQVYRVNFSVGYQNCVMHATQGWRTATPATRCGFG